MRLTPAQQQLVEQYVPLAKLLVGHRIGYLRARMVRYDADALHSDAMFGLVRAAKNYDPTHPASFMTYAWQCISKLLRSSSLDRIRLRGKSGDLMSPTTFLFSSTVPQRNSTFDPFDYPARDTSVDEQHDSDELTQLAFADLTPIQREIVLSPFVEIQDDRGRMRPLTDRELADKHGRNRGWVARVRKEAIDLIRAKAESQAA